MDKTGLRAVIVSREGCFKCGEIQAVLEADGVPAEVRYWHASGARLLAQHGFIPAYLPATLLYRGDVLVAKWSGLAEFLEQWEETA